MKERIQKAIARSGLVSRRKAEDLIRQKRVKLNGSVITELGTKVDLDHDTIQIDGTFLELPEEKIYILMHKPHGYICTASDPQGRPTVLSLIRKMPERIYPVGRLDFDTEGLIALTNDGDFAQILQHPSHNIPRSYQVKVHGVPSKKALSDLEDGILLDGRKAYASRVRIIKKTKQNCWIELVLYEGRNRQIKRMLAAIGHPALRIIRTSFGPLALDNLPCGSYRSMKRREIESVRKMKLSRCIKAQS